MSVQSLKGRQRKGKVITAAGWFEDGTIRYVIYEQISKTPPPVVEPLDAPSRLSRRGALTAEQSDLFG